MLEVSFPDDSTSDGQASEPKCELSDTETICERDLSGDPLDDGVSPVGFIQP